MYSLVCVGLVLKSDRWFSHDTAHLEFLGDAATYDENFDGTAFISAGNTVVVDNCAACIHRNVGGRALSNFLQNLGVDYVYTPSYSPDMNVAEFVFGKLNQRTNGPVNAHLISWPCKAQNIQNLENIW